MSDQQSSTEDDGGADGRPSDAPFDAGDPTAVGERKKKAKTDERERLEGLALLMNHKQGRRYVWWLLGLANVLQQSFNPDPYIHAFNAGTRNVGIIVLNEVMKQFPDQYLLMTKENAHV